MLILSCFVSLEGGESLSVTFTVNVAVPATEGVPEITPEEDNDNPAGNTPLSRLQLYGEIPPSADRVWLYTLPTIPSARLVVLIDKGGASVIVILSCCVSVEAGASLSVTFTVNVSIPATEGVPEITPEDDNDKPAGNTPLSKLQLYGEIPPIAERL